ncbi:MAG: hypothetical protein IV097_17550 [Burkholderiaceae bacterium]|nr:hypothetical protein [Burkholderiaceae bacterium]
MSHRPGAAAAPIACVQTTLITNQAIHRPTVRVDRCLHRIGDPSRLYCAAGPNGGQDGLLGKLTVAVVPEPASLLPGLGARGWQLRRRWPLP